MPSSGSGMCVCEDGEERHGNTSEREIVYIRAFLKSPYLLKLEKLHVLILISIQNLREAKSGIIIIYQHSYIYNCLLFYLSFPLHSSSSVVLPPEMSQDLPNCHWITVLLTRYVVGSLTNPAIFHTLCGLFICMSYFSSLNN